MMRSMSGFSQNVIAIIAASGLGFAFYCLGTQVAVMVRGSAYLATHDPILVTFTILTFPFTAGMALATRHILAKAFGKKR